MIILGVPILDKDTVKTIVPIALNVDNKFISAKIQKVIINKRSK